MARVIPETLIVDGLGGLQRAFARAGREVEKDVKVALADAALPVKQDAQRLALTSISHMTVPWSEMRIGVTRRAVYVAPRKRSTRRASRKRSNLAPLLLTRSMIPAVRANAGKVQDNVEQAMVKVAHKWAATA